MKKKTWKNIEKHGVLPVPARRNRSILKKDLRYKRELPSYFRHHLIKGCSARGHLDLFPEEIQNKTKLNTGKAVRTLIYFKLHESL